jgi:hypothetical protein
VAFYVCYLWCLVLDLSCLTCDFVALTGCLVVCLVDCLTWLCFGTLVPIGTSEAKVGINEAVMSWVILLVVLPYWVDNFHLLALKSKLILR